MAAAWIQPPDTAWGTVRLLTVALQRLGYRVDEVRYIGTGKVRLVLH